MREITDAEFALIKRSVGGLNYNRVGQALDADGRFKAAVLGANADALNALVERIEPHDAPPVSSVLDLGSLGIGATPWTTIGPGQTAIVRATADGLASSAESGGSFRCWGNVGAAPGSFPTDEAVTSVAAGTSPRLKITAGQYFTFKHEGPTPLSMHASIEG